MARVDRASLRGHAQTVLGTVAPGRLGPTLMHEHLLCDLRPPSQRRPEDLGPEIRLDNVWAIAYGTVKAARKYVLDDVEVVTAELRRMQAAGGRSIVDLTCGGIGPRPEALVQIARATGAHVVMGCGHYVDEFQPAENRQRTVEDFAREMVEAAFQGAWGSDVRALSSARSAARHRGRRWSSA